MIAGYDLPSLSVIHVDPKLIPWPTTLFECVSVIGPPRAIHIGSTFNSSSLTVISPCLSFISTVNTPSNSRLLLSTVLRSLVTNLEKNNLSSGILIYNGSYYLILPIKNQAHLEFVKNALGVTTISVFDYVSCDNKCYRC